MNISKDNTRCLSFPHTAPIDFVLPVDEKTELICTHSSGVGSHSWVNAYFALDLASEYNRAPSILRAAADGKAFLFGDSNGQPCKPPGGTPANSQVDDCGHGWGNHVKILHSGGYFSFYVHLEKALVKDGQFVKQGEMIGVEGTTGLAGHRHLHWSVQKLPGNSQQEWESRISRSGDSVPFVFEAMVDGFRRRFNSADVKCANASIGQAPSYQQPRFWGIAVP